MNLSQSKGCKDIFKKQSCKSVIIMWQFLGTVVGDGIPGCCAPMGFIDALTFLRSVAAAAKSRQSCPPLCDPIDGSPPGSSVPGVLQARTLE